MDRTIQLCEIGGGMTNTGHATVIAGVDGRPLSPVYRDYCANGTHAIYWVHVALEVSYSRHHDAGHGEVRLVGIDRRAPQQVGVEDVLLWEFSGPDDFSVARGAEAYLRHNRERDTMTLQFPILAAQAAIAKSQCYHCRCVHFAK